MYSVNGQYELVVAPCADLATINGDVGFLAPGFMPVVIRAVAVGPFTVITNAVGIVRIDKRVTPGSDTGRVNGDVTTINIPNATAVGSIIYKQGLSYKVSPGTEIVAKVQATSGATKANVSFFLEQSPETAANLTKLTATT